MLRWTKVRGARYYNVQLLRDGRKLLSAWPGRPRFKLERAWRFNGHRFRLKPGRRYTLARVARATASGRATTTGR